MKSIKILSILTLLAAANAWGKTIDPSVALNQILSSDSRTANILGDASPEVRDAALEAALYPDVLDRLTQQQKETSSQFQNLIASYPRKTQEKAYNLVRYPQLMQELVSGGPKSKDQIKALTRDDPKSIQDAAQDLGRKEYSLLDKVQSLYARSDQDFDQSLRALPSQTQRAYHTLLSNPEVLTALANDRNFTLAMGEAYRVHPEATRTQINNLASSNNAEQQTALTDYRNTLNNDPKAREELKKSTQDFANQYGYDDSNSDYPPPSYNNYNNDSGSTVVSININPYPFWFGYPTWYAAPLWRPYPLWYMSGYYGYGAGYVWGWPSYYYSSWFYRTPYHFARYPYLASCYGNYYHRWYNRPVNNSFYRTVNNWHYSNRNSINQDLWRNDRYSSNRWRDYGHSQEWKRRGQDSPNPAFRPPNQENGNNGSNQYSGKDRGNHYGHQNQNNWNHSNDHAGNQPSHSGSGKDRNWHRGQDHSPSSGNNPGHGQDQAQNNGNSNGHGKGRGDGNGNGNGNGQGGNGHWNGRGNDQAQGPGSNQGQKPGRGHGKTQPSGSPTPHSEGGSVQASRPRGNGDYGNGGNPGKGGNGPSPSSNSSNDSGGSNSGSHDRGSWGSGGTASANRGGGSWNGGSSGSSWGSRSSSGGGFSRSSSSFGGGGGGFHGSSRGGFSGGGFSRGTQIG